MFCILKSIFPETSWAILYKINWTNFWGQIKRTYLKNGISLCKCVYKKKTLVTNGLSFFGTYVYAHINIQLTILLRIYWLRPVRTQFSQVPYLSSTLSSFLYSLLNEPCPPRSAYTPTLPFSFLSLSIFRSLSTFLLLSLYLPHRSLRLLYIESAHCRRRNVGKCHIWGICSILRQLFTSRGV